MDRTTSFLFVYTRGIEDNKEVNGDVASLFAAQATISAYLTSIPPRNPHPLQPVIRRAYSLHLSLSLSSSLLVRTNGTLPRKYSFQTVWLLLRRRVLISRGRDIYRRRPEELRTPPPSLPLR